MLCTAMSSGGSDWLRRLRSSKGFPDTDHSDLEHFLSNALHQIHPQTTRPDERLELEGNSPTEVPDDNGEIQERDLINNVIAELFHMGECRDLSRIKNKKSCRKQQCPKIYILSANSDAEDLPVQRDSVSLPLDSTNIREAREVGEEPKEREQEQGQKKVERERGHVDLSAYSQTEVTVIDTSVSSWKFEKTLFRRKNVWKVGDKNAKGSMSGDKKKKKACTDENGGGQKKKLKIGSSSSKHVDGEDCGSKKKKLKKLSGSSKHVDKEKTIAALKPPQGHDQTNKTTAANNEEKQDNSGPVQEKRQVDEGSSSVILIKSIPTMNKKNMSGVPKKK